MRLDDDTASTTLTSTLLKPHFKMVDKPRRAKPRLIEMRRVLTDEVPFILNGHKFNMREWVMSQDYLDGVDDTSNRMGDRMCDPLNNFVPIKCNTAACACGWGALLSPKLRRAGLRVSGRSIQGGGIKVQDVFGLTAEGTAYLFHVGYYCHVPSYKDAVGEPARLECIRRIDQALDEIGVTVA